MALWDIKGKALDVPVYELLGGRMRDRIQLYANAWYDQGMSPDEFSRAARDVRKLGVKGLKFNPWGRRPGIDFYRLDDSHIAPVLVHLDGRRGRAFPLFCKIGMAKHDIGPMSSSTTSRNPRWSSAAIHRPEYWWGLSV